MNEEYSHRNVTNNVTTTTTTTTTNAAKLSNTLPKDNTGFKMVGGG